MGEQSVTHSQIGRIADDLAGFPQGRQTVTTLKHPLGIDCFQSGRHGSDLLLAAVKILGHGSLHPAIRLPQPLRGQLQPMFRMAVAEQHLIALQTGAEPL